MSVNKEYGESMEKAVKGLVENSSYDKVTNHVTFDAKKLEMPEGVTTESMATHVEFINNLSAQAEQAVAEVARAEYANNDKLTTVDGTLDMGSFTVNSQHHLSQQVGDAHLHGHSTTAIDYVHTEEQASWLDTQRSANQDLAAKLFA